MTWGTYYSWAAVLISADGLSAGKPQPLVDTQFSLAGLPAAAWMNDAYTVAVPLQIQSAGYPQLVRLLRVAADGTISRVADILNGEFSFGPTFAAGADDTRLIYGGVAPGGSGDLAVMLRRLGSGGELLSSPSTLGGFPMYGGRAPAVAFGVDTVVLLTGNQYELLTVARVDAGGNVVGRQDVASAPGYDFLTYDIVRRGPDAVVAWMKPGSPLMLARVLP
jgi:hypothetical protein